MKDKMVGQRNDWTTRGQVNGVSVTMTTTDLRLEEDTEQFPL